MIHIWPGVWVVASWATTPIISKVLPVANSDTGWKPMLCYAALRRRVVALGARNSPQKAFRQIANLIGSKNNSRRKLWRI